MVFRSSDKSALVVLSVLMCASLGTARAADGPVAVSPGDASKLALVEGRCPTFSWGAVAGARSYELVVFRVSEGSEEEEPVLRETLAGSASSWTPSLNRCLERGGEYGWSVRAIGDSAPSGWSPPSLFRVAPGPSAAEFEDALQLVRSYLGAGGKTEPKAPSKGVATSPPPARPPAAGSVGAPLTPPAVTKLSVDGNVDAVSFTGNGENLTGVVTAATVLAELCNHHARRYLDQGDGTVLDCHTGLFWLKDASCADLAGTDSLGRGTWATAQSAAAVLASGICGLTDGSSAGDWRQPTISELCSAGAIVQTCPAANAPDSLIDSSLSGSPKVENAIGDAQWSEGDAFVGVQSFAYWSATEAVAGSAWYVGLDNGFVNSASKTITFHVWPVRGGP